MNEASGRASIAARESLPTGWQFAELREICLPAASVDPRKQYSGDFLYVDVSTIDGHSGRIGDPASIKPAEAPSRARQLLRKGDVLVSGVRVYLRNTALVDARLDGQIGSTAFCVLRPAEGIDSRYLYWLVRSDDFVNRLIPLQRGNSPPAVLDEDIKAQRVPVPPESEQRRIVAKIDELFSDIEEGERCLARAEALLKQYRQSVLKAAVTGELTRDWRAKNKGQGETGADLLRRILAARRAAWEKKGLEKTYVEPTAPETSKLPSLPESWRWATLDQIIIAIEAGKNFRCDERPPTADEFGVVKVSAVTWGVFDEVESKTIRERDQIDKRWLIRPGDFLFSRANTIELVGACVIAGEFTRKLLLSDKILRFRLALPVENWLDCVLKSHIGRQQIESLATGNQNSMRNIAQENIRRICVPIPPTSEMDQILAVSKMMLDARESVRISNCKEGARATALRQSILHAAFSGKLVPQDPADEPASALLARIVAERSAAPAAKPRARRR